MTSDFHFDLPESLIAQLPTPLRDTSRLLVLKRPTCGHQHLHFPSFPSFLNPGDVLVINDSRVIKARLRGANEVTGGQFEMLLLEETESNTWWAMMKPGKRARIGTRVRLLTPQGDATGLCAEVVDVNPEGHRCLQFFGTSSLLDDLETLGEVPLPPYIQRPHGTSAEDDVERYQTVYAAAPGSVAAPTAGLHFTEVILNQIRNAGVTVCSVTLHVGPGTFAPVKEERLERHPMHEERFVVPESTARHVMEARARGNKVVAAGTTSLRVMESVAANNEGQLVPGCGRTRLFIYPPHNSFLTGALLTNFHLPRSTLLMLVSAFAQPGGVQGRERLLSAYAEAVRERYRFFSYGDAMLIL